MPDFSISLQPTIARAHYYHTSDPLKFALTKTESIELNFNTFMPSGTGQVIAMNEARISIVSIPIIIIIIICIVIALISIIAVLLRKKRNGANMVNMHTCMHGYIHGTNIKLYEYIL